MDPNPVHLFKYHRALLLNHSNLQEVDFMEGAVLLVDKPLGFSSFKVVHQIKVAIDNAIEKKVKIGHAGTLDPLATGLLILCTGKLTKQINQFQGLVKLYSGKMILGATRPTYDLESEIDFTFDTSHVTDQMMEDVRTNFIGEQMMTPPIHSAVKFKGKRAYELARKGKEVQLESKPICIHRFEIDTKDFPEIQFVVSCSKGTYIRSLVSEFGKRLQCGAYLSALSRDAIGTYTLESAFQLEDLKKLIMTKGGR
jgi:tRNA pseudouridine55 synthase